MNAPRQVSDGSLFDETFKDFGLLIHIVHFLPKHEAHRQLIIVMHWNPFLGQVVAKAREAHLVTQQTS